MPTDEGTNAEGRGKKELQQLQDNKKSAYKGKNNVPYKLKNITLHMEHESRFDLFNPE